MILRGKAGLVEWEYESEVIMNNNNIITSAVRTETEKRAYILFLMIGTTYDIMPDMDSWLIPDDEDKEAAREMRAFIIKGNTIEFSYELFKSLQDICSDLFGVLSGKHYNPMLIKKNIENTLSIMKEEFPFLPFGQRMGKEEIETEIINGARLLGWQG